LQCGLQGGINPLPQTKKQFKQTQTRQFQLKNRKHYAAKYSLKLYEIRKKIIENHSQE